MNHNSAAAPRRLRAERGASLVEFALIVPLLFTVVLGLFSGGIAYNRKISMTSAVREGARFGATLPAGATAPFAAAQLDAWRTSVKGRVVTLSGGELENADVCAELVRAPDAADTCGVEDPDDTPAGSHVVKISATRPASIETLVYEHELTLRSRVAARYEREPV